MYNSQGMHYIQRDIILSLAHNSPQRFSDLQPYRIPNNTFSYHLKRLREGGYVVSTGDGYIATRKALKLLMINANHPKRNNTPALLTAIYVTNSVGDVLLLKRNNKPFENWFGIPSGLVHSGESMETAAYRELSEKTSISASSGLSFVGVLDFRYLERESKDLFVHAVAFVYKYEHKGLDTKISKPTYYGELIWSHLNHKKILPEVYTIAGLVKDDGCALKSVDYEEPVG